MTESGVVKRWLAEKGFGFITRDDGEDVFCHQRDIGGGALIEGQPVQFDLGEDAKGDAKGKLKAVNLSGEGYQSQDDLNGKGSRPYEGVVKAWLDEKRYGFLKGNHIPGEEEADIFVHARDLGNHADGLIPGATVYYHTKAMEGKRESAVDLGGPGVIPAGKGKGKGKGKGDWWGDPWGGWGAPPYGWSGGWG
eukprot:Hpha_TRINITY_DN2973_c0_g1::TRINITY_DN2973_c0_g1_i1::g.19542::m.19542